MAGAAGRDGAATLPPGVAELLARLQTVGRGFVGGPLGGVGAGGPLGGWRPGVWGTGGGLGWGAGGGGGGGGGSGGVPSTHGSGS